MPNIINEVKLDFKDVLLRPKRSTLRSRNDDQLDFDAIYPGRANKSHINWNEFIEKIIEINKQIQTKKWWPCLSILMDLMMKIKKLPSQIKFLCNLVPPKGRLNRRQKNSATECVESFIINVKVDLYREITFRNSGQTYKGVPVMASNMDTVGTFEMARELSKNGLFTCIHKYYTIEEWKKFAADHPACLEHMAASSGTAEADFERLTEILNTVKDLKFICLDVANGYSQHFVEYLRKVRAAFPTHTIIAGNVVTGEMVEELILSGADIIKVGIGPGSVCTTRIKTGVGYPQLSAVIECADAAHGLKGHIISDGGCTCPGDVAKAFGAGADFVMAGGMFAGHDQCGGDVVTTADGRKVKLFYGMSSSTAMQKHSGGMAEYRSSEGKTVEVEYRGDVGVTVKDILGGLRSACTYVGASHLRELPRRATFIRCCRQANDTFS